MVRVTPTPYNQLSMSGSGNSSRMKGAWHSLFDLTEESLGELVAGWMEPAYRSRQIVEWVYRPGVGD